MQPYNKLDRTELAMATFLVLSIFALVLGAPADSNQQQVPPSAGQLTSPLPPLTAINQEQTPGPMSSDNSAQQQASPQMTVSNSINGQSVPMPPQMPLSPSSAYPTTFMQASQAQQQQQHHHHHHHQQQHQVTRLPNINIYASKSEVKKLLGLPNTRIDYVTNGQLNTYPLGFTIPMGYGQSDMIFTWQNQGQTNVNYSISLRIGNLIAVEPPLINITRMGLIPRHEQVFKITLPCSGKVSDEIDVQVLFNITGLVPVALTDFGEPGALDDPSAATPDSSAIQQQNELIAAAVSNASAHLFAAGEQMQADQQVGAAQEARKSQMRRVSHTLAIKRKKICTANPLPVIGPKPRQPDMIRPPTQPLPNGGIGSLQAPVAIPPAPRPAPDSAQQPQAATASSPQIATAVPSHVPGWQDSTTFSVNAQDLVPVPAPPPSPSQPSTPQAPISSASHATTPSSQNYQHHLHHNQPRRPELAWPRSPVGQNAEPPNNLIDSWRLQPAAGHAQQANGGAGGNSPLVFMLIVMTLVVLAALIALLVLGGANSPGPIYGRPSPLDKLRALTNCIWRRTSAGSRAVNKCTKHVGPITIKNGIIGTFGTTRHHHHDHHHQDAHMRPNTLGRIRDGGMLHAGTKSTVSSISGLSTISGQNGKLQHAQNANFNSLMGPYYCKQQQPAGNYAGYYGGPATTTTTNGDFHGGPYHITMSNNQTTKLFLAGNGSNSGQGHTTTTNHRNLEHGNYTIDNSYMPIATTTGGHGFLQPNSDNGSVYQTIY